MSEPIDPDVDLHFGSQRRAVARSWAPVLLAISLGGGLGSLARYGFSVLLPAAPGGFPWATLSVNLLGCLFMGVLMVLITEVWSAHRLLRPFLGVGVLGGFTTFSTYAVEVHQQLLSGTALAAFGYLTGTVLGALLAVLAGAWSARRTAAVLRGRVAG
ncbi:fluoride efflux transporter CrcB [Saccharopolyspora sp. HNM0983]|uniref:Fluoride-specific ion channel FluC n=1 Tax=Saccharopolyspora montiporae TaxID=2781240 RepID=A0A929B8X2_9PSEU|nr:fluoride efflux transporter CrcB [Saccharopolyspora sp. HNM0983]MBE9373723.1 fluoride efflux transporter CrcB [Saccharopolyspora sp. HNM0983]